MRGSASRPANSQILRRRQINNLSRAERYVTRPLPTARSNSCKMVIVLASEFQRPTADLWKDLLTIIDRSSRPEFESAEINPDLSNLSARCPNHRAVSRMPLGFRRIIPLKDVRTNLRRLRSRYCKPKKGRQTHTKPQTPPLRQSIVSPTLRACETEI